MKKVTNNKYDFFFCPASDYLNQYNETGSHGQLSYNFLKHLAQLPNVNKIIAIVMLSLPVTKIPKTKIKTLLHKRGQRPALRAIDSFIFYLNSYFTYVKNPEYKNADIVHHIIPFKFGRTFNLFFIFKDTKKKYIIGPIVSPHINNEISTDEEYVYTPIDSGIGRLRKKILTNLQSYLLNIFGKLFFMLSYKTLQNADILFFSDEYSLKNHRKYISEGQKVFLLDTGIDLEVFKPSVKKRPLLDNKTLHVLFVGRLTKRKGCEYLIAAISQLKKTHPEIKVHCIIIGDGPLKHLLEKSVKELKLSTSITFLGNMKNDDIAHYYHTTDVVCIPALSDTFTSIKEALASGSPVIVTEICSHGERVKDGYNGFLIPPKNSGAIAEKLYMLYKEPTILEKITKNAPLTRSEYDWNIIAKKYMRAVL